VFDEWIFNALVLKGVFQGTKECRGGVIDRGHSLASLCTHSTTIGSAGGAPAGLRNTIKSGRTASVAIIRNL